MWLYGTHVADLGAHDERMQLTWTSEASERWGFGARVMSELLPVQRVGEQAQHRRVAVFLNGLLAEGNVREHLAFEAGIPADDVFGMIAAYGRDTAGALVFLPSDAGPPDRIGSWEPTTDSAIARRLRSAGRYAADGLESNSLAGVQPKIVLRKGADGWYRCLDGAPSTHIVKLGHPPDSPIHDVIHTEAASIALARALGLSAVDAQVADFEGVSALVVSRYDRRVASDGVIDRIHQEDTAQALGLDTSDMTRKFQRGKGLPSLRAIATVLRGGGQEPDKLLALTAFNLAIGNSDAHAKNISLIRHDDGSAELAPAYDVAMHAHHSGFSGVFAMDVIGRNRMAHLSADDLLREAESWPLPVRRAHRVVRDTLVALEAALATVDRAEHPGVPARAWSMVQARTRELIRSLP